VIKAKARERHGSRTDLTSSKNLEKVKVHVDEKLAEIAGTTI